MNAKEAMEIEFLGKVKIVILSGSKEIAHHPDEGSIVRGYMEFDDVAMPSGKTFRQEIKEDDKVLKGIPHRKPLDDTKPLRWPIWMGELSELTQDEIVEN